MNLVWCFVLLVGTVMVSTHEIHIVNQNNNINNFFNFVNEIVNVTKNVYETPKNNIIHKWPTLASIWVKATAMSIIPTLKCTGVIISKKHVLTQYDCAANLPVESIGVAYGLQDTRNIKFGDIYTPKKIFKMGAPDWINLYVLEMDTIKYTELVQPACISPYFEFKNKALTATGFSRILGPIKTINTSLINLTVCKWKESDIYRICQSITPITDESKMISGGSPIQWFNPNNKKWILVGIERSFNELNSPFMHGYNITYFYPAIKKIVEDGSSKLSTC